MRQSVFMVPAPIVTYNIFIIGVDRFDQIRSTNAMMQKERRDPTSIFTVLLDAALHNAFLIREKTDRDRSTGLLKFRSAVAEALVSETLRKASQVDGSSDKEIVPRVSSIGSVDSTHLSLENKDSKPTQCALCLEMASDNVHCTFVYSCTACKRGFHIDYSSLYHFKGSLKVHSLLLLQLIHNTDGNSRRKKRRYRENHCTSTLENCGTPFPLRDKMKYS